MSLHINAKPGQIAKNVVVAGDPGRVEYIAKTYLKDAVLVNDQRGALHADLRHGALPGLWL